MKLSLPPHIAKLIEDRIRSGKYHTAEDVVAAAMSNLEEQESRADFDPGELDRLLDEGENSGPPLDGEQVLAEVRGLRKQSKAG
jgi:putative addiction module CopG family antidote